MIMREQAAALFRQLRGSESVAALARRIGVSRQGVMKIEEGSVSLARLDGLAAVYGVDFWLVAVDPRGYYWTADGVFAGELARVPLTSGPDRAAGLVQPPGQTD